MFFSFTYLYSFQGEMMRMVQHLLSNGRTHYQVFLFSTLITIGLTFLGLLILRFVSLPCRYKALAWIPSYAILGWLTDVSLSMVDPSSHSIGATPFVLLTIVYFALIYILYRIQEPINNKATTHEMAWPNMFILVIGMAFTGWVGNTNRTIHYQLRMERLCIEENYSKLLKIGADDPNSSRCVMTLRVYALSKLGTLGDQLFRFPNNLNSDCMLPLLIDSMRPANMPRRLQEHLGGFPIKDMSATHFLQHLAADTVVKQPVREYLLCALLLDKDLDTFVDSLISFYGDKVVPQVPLDEEDKRLNKNKKEEKEPIRMKSLPRYYAEALLLYSQLKEKPKALLDESKMLENYNGFESCLALPDSMEREQKCREEYGETYWNYYYFTDNK